MKKRTRPARTLSDACVRYRSKLRPIAITLYPNGMLGLRLHGTRLEVEIDPHSIYDLAMKIHVATNRAERRKGRATL